MKKQIWYALLTAILCLAMVFSLAACDNETETTAADDGTTTAAPDGDESSTPDGDDSSASDDGGSNTPHTHTYADGWSHDETHHWHAATCEHSDEKADYAEHAWDEGTVTTEPTCAEKGVKTFTCSGCGATKTEEIPQLTEHTYAEGWSHDETHHWHATTCEHSDEKSDYAEHAWDAGTVTTEPTCAEKGVKTLTCSGCGATKTEEIAATGNHAYNDEDQCTVCGAACSYTVGLEFDLSSDGQSYELYGIGTATDTFIYIPPTYNDLPVKKIGDYAFQNCTAIIGIRIPNSITEIGYKAFEGCTNLADITIPKSITRIGASAFGYCSSLASVHISDISAWCTIFHGDYFVSSFSYPYNLYLNGTLVTDLVIADGVTSIYSRAFSGCTSLTSVRIGDSVTSIGDFAFLDCTSLTAITIPDSVTSIGEDAFSGCSKLLTTDHGVTYVGNYVYDYGTPVTSVKIKDGTIGILPSAFYGCEGLTSITIPDSITSIGDYAFYDCTSLTSVTIGDSVTSIGSYAFEDCTSLTTVYYTGTAAEWDSIEIGSYGNSYLTSATRYYYSETEPTDTDNLYWHYVEGVPTAW